MYDPSKVARWAEDGYGPDVVDADEFDNCAAALADAEKDAARYLAEADEALKQRDEALRVVKMYREQRGRHDHARDCMGPAECGVIDDDRCSICKAADEALGGK